MDQAELIKIIEKAAREQYTTLDLSGRGITQLPENIGRLTKLQKLGLGDNQLRTLPHQIGQLANLEVLHLYGNNLERLPRSIGELGQLRSLVIGSRLASFCCGKDEK